MVHQMCEAHFVNTFENKDNLLIYSKILKRFAKVHTKCRKMLFLSFVLSFSFNSQKFTYDAFFLFIHLFICVAVNLAK